MSISRRWANDQKFSRDKFDSTYRESVLKQKNNGRDELLEKKMDEDLIEWAWIKHSTSWFLIFYFPIHFGNTNKRNKDQNNDDDEQNNDHHEQDNDDDAENDNYVDLMSVFAHRAASHELEVAHLSNLWSILMCVSHVIQWR